MVIVKKPAMAKRSFPQIPRDPNEVAGRVVKLSTNQIAMEGAERHRDSFPKSHRGTRMSMMRLRISMRRGMHWLFPREDLPVDYQKLDYDYVRAHDICM